MISVTRATRVVDLVTDAELYARWQTAAQALADAQRAATTDAREADTRVRDAAAAVRLVEDDMRASTVRFTLRAMTRSQWARWVATHQPREGDKVDELFGVDVSALDSAIAVMVERVDDADGAQVDVDMTAEWARLADEMSQPQWEAFATAALEVNQGKDTTGVPFSRAASAVTRRSDQT